MMIKIEGWKENLVEHIEDWHCTTSSWTNLDQFVIEIQEEYSDLLDVAIIHIRGSKQYHELRTGLLICEASKIKKILKIILKSKVTADGYLRTIIRSVESFRY